MGNIKFDGVLLTIDQHEAIDMLRSRLIERGCKELADMYSEQMHHVFMGLASKNLDTLITFSFNHVALMKQISIKLMEPVAKFSKGGIELGLTGSENQEIMITPSGEKILTPKEIRLNFKKLGK